MLKRNPERPQINSQNHHDFSEEERADARDAWRELALSGEKNLKYAFLQGANLRNADLQDADLQGANLYYANLQGADLQSAKLRSANLRHADLRSANLRYADLRNADLYAANLLGANLQGANLFLADLTDVIELTDEQIRSARNVLQLQSSEFSEIPEDFRSYEPLNRMFKAQTLRK